MDHRQHRRLIKTYLRDVCSKSQTGSILALLIESGSIYCLMWVSNTIVLHIYIYIYIHVIQVCATDQFLCRRSLVWVLGKLHRQHLSFGKHGSDLCASHTHVLLSTLIPQWPGKLPNCGHCPGSIPKDGLGHEHWEGISKCPWEACYSGTHSLGRFDDTNRLFPSHFSARRSLERGFCTCRYGRERLSLCACSFPDSIYFPSYKHRIIRFLVTRRLAVPLGL